MKTQTTIKTTSYPGIDYSAGQPVNRNPQTGIRYGIIPQNDLGEFAFEDIIQNGTDLDFESYLSEAKDKLRSALSDYFSEHNYGGDKFSTLDRYTNEAFDAVRDGLCDNYESSGDCTRYLYEQDGYKLQTESDGDIFVMESPYFTYAQFCSPCAPGACYLRSPLDHQEQANKCYCLGHDWFDAENPCPHPVYSVETGMVVES